jgi:hypothetical protein
VHGSATTCSFSLQFPGLGTETERKKDVLATQKHKTLPKRVRERERERERERRAHRHTIHRERQTLKVKLWNVNQIINETYIYCDV